MILFIIIYNLTIINRDDETARHLFNEATTIEEEIAGINNYLFFLSYSLY